MDIIKMIKAVCDDMTTILTEEQLFQLESSMYKYANLFDDKALTTIDINTDIQCVKMFTASKRLAGRAESTLQAYCLELWGLRKKSGKSFIELTTFDIKKYFMTLQMDGLKLSTLNNKRLYFSSFFEFLYDEGIRKDNPMKRIEPFKEPKIQRHAYSIADIESLRGNCENIRDRTIIEFFLATGLRVSEVTQLRVRDLDMRNKKIKVVGKGNKEREVFYNELAEFYLHKYLAWRIQHEGISERELLDRYLFASLKAPYKKLDNNGIRALMKRMGRQSHVENVHPHRFRRTFATSAISRQMPIEKLRSMLGHEKIETTLLYVDDRSDLEYTYKMYMT